MERPDSLLKPVCTTENDLRADGRRGREDRERQDAIIRAEEACRVAGADDQRPACAEADVLRFAAQLRLIEARVFTMLRIDAVLLPDGTQGREARRFTHSIREAERLELGATTA